MAESVPARSDAGIGAVTQPGLGRDTHLAGGLLADDAALSTVGVAVAGDTAVLWRALAVVRVVLLGYAMVVNAMRWADYQRPGVAAAVLVVLAGWTVAAPWLYAAPRRRPAAIIAESALAFVALVLTPWAHGTATVEPGAQSLCSFWLAAPVLACAIQWEWRGGLVSAVAASAADLAIRAEPDITTASNLFLLLVIGLIVGYVSCLIRTSTRERAEAAAAKAATAERERLARAVHDGVLQALSYVQRRGTEIGGPATELANLAEEQEAALRALMAGIATGTGPGPGADCSGEVRDVAAMLHLHAGRSASVATPGQPVPLPAHAAAELVAAVQAVLDNTARHAAGASAYVLVEDDGEAVVVSVGDNGPGITPGRLEEAVAAGRMGIAHSIRSRLGDLGGTADLATSPGAGTEWQLRVPREPRRRR